MDDIYTGVVAGGYNCYTYSVLSIKTKIYYTKCIKEMEDGGVNVEENNKITRRLLTDALNFGRIHIPEGKTADYIPELGKADKNQLGICIFTREGRQYREGDVTQRFTMQSISKIINLAVTLQYKGFDKVFQKVKMEPSGDAFNSFVKLDMASDYPYNPMINSGAIAVVGDLAPEYNFDFMLDFTRKLCMDNQIRLDDNVYLSEKSTSARNRSIAYLLSSKGVLEGDVEACLDLYIRMCSLSITAESLAGLGVILGNDGVNPNTRERYLDSKVVRVIKTLMLTCGMYDESGEFAVRVGIPSKSGVGGGILSVVDGRMGIGIFGPSLDQKGNSIAGGYVLEYLSENLRLHMFDFPG